MRWMPLQNVNSKKWVLCVRKDDCRTYETTDIASDSIEQISAYAAYMNQTANVMGIDTQMRRRLDVLKQQYGNPLE